LTDETSVVVVVALPAVIVAEVPLFAFAAVMLVVPCAIASRRS
jgi:hypothetical protein